MNWQKEKTVNKKDDQYDSSPQNGLSKDKSFDRQKSEGQSGTAEQNGKAEQDRKAERTFEGQTNGPKDFEKNRTENQSNKFGRL